MKKSVYSLLRASFVFYFIILSILLLARNNHYPDSLIERITDIANFTPMRTIIGFIRDAGTGEIAPLLAVRNILGNLAAFMPMGFYLPCFFERLRSPLRTASAVYLIVLAFETVQIVTGLGCFDVDDLILNVAGSLAGYGLYMICERFYNHRKELRT